MNDYMYLVDTFEAYKGKIERTSQLLFHDQGSVAQYLLDRDSSEYIQVKKVYILDAQIG